MKLHFIMIGFIVIVNTVLTVLSLKPISISNNNYITVNRTINLVDLSRSGYFRVQVESRTTSSPEININTTTIIEETADVTEEIIYPDVTEEEVYETTTINGNTNKKLITCSQIVFKTLINFRNDLLLLSTENNFYSIKKNNQKFYSPIHIENFIKYFQNLKCIAKTNKGDIYIFTDTTFYKYNPNLKLYDSYPKKTKERFPNFPNSVKECSIIENKLFIFSNDGKYYVYDAINKDLYCNYPKKQQLLLGNQTLNNFQFDFIDKYESYVLINNTLYTLNHEKKQLKIKSIINSKKFLCYPN